MPIISKKESPSDAERYNEHSIVVLKRPLTTEDGVLPAGTRGVVHDANRDGSAYLVEFDDPFLCVIEVRGKDLHRG